ncbi:MAG: ATP-dependent DNA helicase [Microthrixaceae bacterium]|nr:ATP-dependent DNA helicase [Microthrixaceae bacterium]
MAEAVADAITGGHHLVVQAGTGTGKSLAYLVPAALSATSVVVVTATKALQDQLVTKDLPFLADHLDRDLDFALLKGRSNYLCRQRLAELDRDQGSLDLDDAGTRSSRELERLQGWAATTETGDRAELDFEPSVAAWSAVSVGPRECPGAAKCPRGEDCFAEQARRVAAEADVLVVNTHLYGTHLASGGAVLPEHEVVVFDEAHQLEEVISATAGFELSGGRLHALSRTVGAVLEDPSLTAALDAAADRLTAALAPEVDRRLRGAVDPELADALLETRARLEQAQAALRKVPSDGPGDVAARRERAVKATTSLTDDVDAVMDVPATHVAWVAGPEATPSLKVAPVDVGEVLREGLWEHRTAILTSATIPPALPLHLGLDESSLTQLDVGSPFDFEAHALLYCAAHLPEPRAAAYEAAMIDELVGLIEAAGGRTLALFTSWRVMEAAAGAAAERLDTPVLTQRDLPKPALVRRFADEPETSLFATMGFWQGVDVPGPSLSLVTIDRLPFPRPDDPLLQARRERARAEAFRLIDLPRAATLLAQGAGRLIRTAEDRGVVAVLDSRLATGNYRWDVVRALPPMRRTRDGAEARELLRSLRGTEAAAAPQ